MIYIKNLIATASNLIGVIESKQWERLDSKTWDLKEALKLVEENFKESGCKHEPDLQATFVRPQPGFICKYCRNFITITFN